MNIALIALGSQGDVQPYVALGVGLKRAGHSVRVVTHENFANLVQAQQLEFCAVAGNVQAFLEQPETKALLASGNFIKIMRHAQTASKHAAELWALQGLEACRGAEAIVAGVGGLFAGLAIAEKLNLPLIQAHVFPFTPTAEFAGALFPPQIKRLGAGITRLSHEILRQIIWQTSRSGDNAGRQKIGMPPAPFFGLYGHERLNRFPTLCGFSPSVIAPPKDWHKAVVTGYWFLEPGNWTAPPELERFLADGNPPVFIGFGSMASRDPEKTANLVLEALHQTKQRAILQTGWGGLNPEHVPENVFVLQAAPHTWLFPRVGAVVHHGGAGTTAAGLQAGVPSLVIPFFGDQPFWGQRVFDLGVGAAPLPRKQLNVERLVAGLRQLEQPQLRQNAAVLGAKIRAEDGVGRAVAAIEQALG
jgi:sterol 3beta-glucosyltransferase